MLWGYLILLQAKLNISNFLVLTSAASIFKQPFPLAFNNETDCSGCGFYLAGPWCAQQLSGQQHVLWLDGLRKADLLLAAGQLRHRFRTTSSQVGLRRGKLHPVITTQDRGRHEDCRAGETFGFGQDKERKHKTQTWTWTGISAPRLA